ncbi:hypothetical protein [Terasakiella sp.]|uniref:hypothetical protein n=1 Tax=Terasakiella sp. TaxID=2034861 RepID=UPI003AA83EC9
MIALNLGFIFGGATYLKGKTWLGNSSSFLKVAIVIVLGMFPFTFFTRVGAFDIGMTSGELYAASHEIRAESGTLIEYIRMVFAVYSFGLFPVLVFYWKNIPQWIRVASIIGVITSMFTTVLMGVNKDIFNHVILLFVFVLLKVRFKEIFSRKSFLAVIIIVASSLFAANFFVSTQITRSGSFAATGVNPKLGYYSKYSQSDGTLFVFYSALTFYLTQGYHAFDLALDLPFESTKGVGNSTFLSRQVDKFAGTHIGDSTYPARLESQNWDRYNYWSTFYLWWASDVHFIGVLILMFAIGISFRLVENTLIHEEEDVGACICYGYYTLMLFYLSANNQLFQSGENFIGFLLVFLPLFFGRRFSQ